MFSIDYTRRFAFFVIWLFAQVTGTEEEQGK